MQSRYGSIPCLVVLVRIVLLRLLTGEPLAVTAIHRPITSSLRKVYMLVTKRNHHAAPLNDQKLLNDYPRNQHDLCLTRGQRRVTFRGE
jgi:hypothetical protein